jgi:hypothetical protein
MSVEIWMSEQICDCGVKEGELHHLNCDMEKCPICGGQSISCGCCYKHFYPDYKGFEQLHTSDPRLFKIHEMSPAESMCVMNKILGPTNGLPLDVYKNGLSSDQQEEWERVLNDIGRVPYIVYPNMCRRCGKLWPDMFHVPTEEWKRYIRIDARTHMLCQTCYDTIKALIDGVDNETD